MQENNTDLEIMRQLIEQKKQKSASQGSIKLGPQDRFGASRQKNKRKKKQVAEPADDE